MIWLAVAHIFSVILELINISRMSDHDKDLEILVLRYQLGIADRKLNRAIKPERTEKLLQVACTVVNAPYEPLLAGKTNRKLPAVERQQLVPFIIAELALLLRGDHGQHMLFLDIAQEIIRLHKMVT